MWGTGMNNIIESLGTTYLRGARCATGPNECVRRTIEISGEKITGLLPDNVAKPISRPEDIDVDLSSYLLMPGFVNSHDHLQYGLHPRIGRPPYGNYVEWGEDIHATCAETIAMYKCIPKDVRLWWGGIRNLLCGVTTVGHHDPLWPELCKQEFPIQVVQEYGWAHSFQLTGNLHGAFAGRPSGSAFFLHACEGIDLLAKGELLALDQLRLLNSDTVLIHGLAIDRDGVAVLKERGASLIVCPSSNHFLFATLPDMSLLSQIENVSLGNDSPLTAAGDLLDEARFTIERCHLSSEQVYRMVTESPARILRLKHGEGTVQISGAADLIAIRDDGRSASERLQTISAEDVELVIVRGQVRLASVEIWNRLPRPLSIRLEPLWIGDRMRWLRAPVKKLLHQAEAVLGIGEASLSGHILRHADQAIESGWQTHSDLVEV
jgi:hypothetical protein